MAACRMGYGCEVKARVNGIDSDVYVVVKVYSGSLTKLSRPSCAFHAQARANHHRSPR
jgi:hypothetical protein